MRILLTIFTLSTVCIAADWRQDCPVKDDWRGQNNWVNATVAWQTNIVTTISTNGDHAAYIAWLNGCGASWRYDWNTGNPDIGIQNLNIQYIDVPNPPTDGAMSGLLQDRAAMLHQRAIGQCPQDLTITTNNTPVMTPIRYRWQDYGLPGPVQ